MFASSRLRIDGVARSDYCASASEKRLVLIRRGDAFLRVDFRQMQMNTRETGSDATRNGER